MADSQADCEIYFVISTGRDDLTFRPVVITGDLDRDQPIVAVNGQGGAFRNPNNDLPMALVMEPSND
jgi:hypothetical protein